MVAAAKHPAENATRDYIDSTEFWRGISRSALMLQYCPVAKAFQHYPRPVSIYTGRRTLEWREASSTGTVYTITEGMIGSAAAGSEQRDVVIALVELDVGVRLLATVDVPASREVQIGDRGRVVFFEHPEGYIYYRFRIDA